MVEGDARMVKSEVINVAFWNAFQPFLEFNDIL